MNNSDTKIYGRAELKNFFKNGHIPTETHFASLIDSLINQSDDGISKDAMEGFVITPIGSSSRLFTFYKDIERLEPLYYLEKDQQTPHSLKFQSADVGNDPTKHDDQAFFIHQSGQIGVGKRCHKNFKMEVDGFSAAQGRIGTYKCGTVVADGQWHTIADNLDNCQAFEVVARVGKKGTGRFAILFATVLNAYGNAKIKKTCANYGFFWNKINLRWRGTTHNYRLEMRTNRNYGEGINIHFNIGKLWDDELFLESSCYYGQNNQNQ